MCANCLYCLKTDRKACGQSNQETRIVGGKPTGVNVRRSIHFWKLSINKSIRLYHLIISWFFFFTFFAMLVAISMDSSFGYVLSLYLFAIEIILGMHSTHNFTFLICTAFTQTHSLRWKLSLWSVANIQRLCFNGRTLCSTIETIKDSHHFGWSWSNGDQWCRC